jgi:tRNA threonylcarbamoyladenosine biosynthesis protein TsaE
LGIGQPVTSPTFTLVNEYHGRLTLYHVDLFRIDQVAEAIALGLEDYLYGDGVCVIEWAERVGPVLPVERLWITFYHLDTAKRRITMRVSGERYQQLLKDFQHAAFRMRNL